jgi:hypothetical protein
MTSHAPVLPNRVPAGLPALRVVPRQEMVSSSNMFRSVLITFFDVPDDGPMPATCADAKALPACTAALQAADKKCYGPVNEDCTTATGTDTGSTCATVNLKAGDKLDPAEPAVTFDYAETNCVEPARCALMKAAMPTLDITCADAATSCGVGNTCSAGSMAQVSMSAVLFALCAALYQL